MSVEPVCVDDVIEIGKAKVNGSVHSFVATGADSEQTLRDNVAAFGRYRLRPSVMCCPKHVSIGTSILGEPISFPVCVAPTSLQCLLHPEGEVATAKGTAKLETCMVLSTSSSTSLESVSHASGEGLRWFQLYVATDRELVVNLVQRAEESGYKALVVTVDAPVVGKRNRILRDGLDLPPHITLGNFTDMAKYTPSDNASTLDEKRSFLVRISKVIVDSSLSWKDISWLMSITSLPVVVKGVLTAEDALIAVQLGVKGILVSNHGARQLDGVPATIEVLKEVVDAVDGRCEVYMDGGVRRGTDVLKALALGARAVFVGRPILWGLSYKGQEGVEQVLKILRDEFTLAMKLSGCPSISQVNKDLVVKESFFHSRL